MELYIHFGIYKAGSSYLQYIAANKREELTDAGVWFPHSPDDKKMKAGFISAGNAFELSEWLKKNEVQKINHYFRKIKQEATERNCNKILLSAEALVHQFAKKDRLELLSNSLKKSGYENIYALAYFRDLVDHCISLYKHRSKSGKNPDFEHWVKEVYETPHVLNEFFEHFQSVDFKWTLKKFRKDSDYMTETFFHDWLEVKFEKLPHKPKVNESITLSEVKVMQLFKKQFPDTVDYLLHKLILMPREKKANDQELEEAYRQKASVLLNSIFYGDLKSWNVHFEQNNYLEIEDYRHHEISSDFAMSLTDSQLLQVTKATQYLSGLKGINLRLRRKVKKLIPLFLVKGYVNISNEK